MTVQPTQSARNPPAIVHRSALADCDVTRVGVIPVTHPARMLVDVAEQLGSGQQLDDLIDATIVRGLATVRAVQDASRRVSKRAGRKGLPALASRLKPWLGGAIPDSVPEMKLYRRVIRWGYPPPARQLAIVAPDGRLLGRADMGWEPFRTGLEYDGGEAHSPRHWESDEAREEAIERLGWNLVRADAADLRPSATRVRDELEFFVPMQAA